MQRLKKKIMVSITKLEHKQKGSVIQITSKSGVETAIMKENVKRFKSVCDSPLLLPSILSEIELSANEELSVRILR